MGSDLRRTSRADGSAASSPFPMTRRLSNSPDRQATWMIMAAPDDVESAAAARTLKLLIQKMAQFKVAIDIGISNLDLPEFLLEHTLLQVIIFLLNQNTLTNASQLVRLTIVTNSMPSVRISPVIIGNSMRFPKDDFFTNLADTGGTFGSLADEIFTNRAGQTMTKGTVSAALKSVLQTIAFSIDMSHLSEEVLAVSVKRVIE